MNRREKLLPEFIVNYITFILNVFDFETQVSE